MKLKIFEISIISYFFRDIGHRLTRPCTDTFAYIFGTWARKNKHFLLHGKFSLFSTQQKCARNNRNETSRLTALFCTKNHQNPFTSLRERVGWRCHTSSKNAPKLKTRVLVMYERIYDHIRAIHDKNTSFLFWNGFGADTASSINSFSKTTKWILMIFSAK